MPAEFVATLERRARRVLKKLSRSQKTVVPRHVLDPRAKRELLDRLLAPIEECQNSGTPLALILGALRDEVGLDVSERTVRRRRGES
jgi:hypothetical protein